MLVLIFVSTSSDAFAMDKAARGGGGNECYQYVTNIQQTSDHNCGTTTVLQTLYALGSASIVPGTTDADKISFLDERYDVDKQGYTMVWQATDALNTYNTHEQTYNHIECTNMSIATFEQTIANSLTNCKPVILHAKTEYLSYYGGKESGHYVSLKEAYDAIHAVEGRFIIY